MVLYGGSREKEEIREEKKTLTFMFTFTLSINIKILFFSLNSNGKVPSVSEKAGELKTMHKTNRSSSLACNDDV